MAKSTSVFGLEENVAGALSYLLGLITGLLFFLLEKENKFVRFHALQSIALSVSILLLSIVFLVITTPLRAVPGGDLFIGIISMLINSVLSLLSIIIYLFLIWKAYNHEKFKLPVIGDFVEKNI